MFLAFLEGLATRTANSSGDLRGPRASGTFMRKRDRQGSEAGQCAAGLWYGKIQMLLQPDESPTLSEVVEMQAVPARSLSSPWSSIELWLHAPGRGRSLQADDVWNNRFYMILWEAH